MLSNFAAPIPYYIFPHFPYARAVVNQHFLLTLLKAEAHTKLQDKVLKMGDEGCLQVRLFHYILGLQTQKLKGKWRLDVKGERICLSLAFHQLRQRLRLLTPSTAEIIVGINLALQFSDTPSTTNCHRLVKSTL